MAEEQGTVMGYPIVVQPVHLTYIEPITTDTAATAAAATNDDNRNFLRALCSDLMFIILILLAGAFVSLTSIFYSPMFEVDSVHVHPFNISNSHITSHWDITFSVRNRNVAGAIDFEDVNASVFYKNENISSWAMIEASKETQWCKPRHTISVQPTSGVSARNITGSIAEEIAADWSHGAVNFTVKFNARARLDSDENHGGGLISVLCDDVKVGFSLNMTRGTMLGGSRGCKVVRFRYKDNATCILFAALYISAVPVLLISYALCYVFTGRRERI